MSVVAALAVKLDEEEATWRKHVCYCLPISSEEFRSEGDFILDDIVDQPTLEMLRPSVKILLRAKTPKMGLVLGVRRSRHHDRKNATDASFCIRDCQILGQFVFGAVMEELCCRLLGPDAYLFYYQFVVKGA